MPAIHVKDDHGIRVDYCFAITLREPETIELGPAGKVGLRNRLLDKDKDGYVGTCSDMCT